MINLSDCYIAKVKSFLGLRSIDPPVPFDKFIAQNISGLKALIEKNQLIVIDDYGNEVDSSLWENYLITLYDNNGETADQDDDETSFLDIDDNEADLEIESQEKADLIHKDEDDSSFLDIDDNIPDFEKEIEEKLELIQKIDAEVKGKIAHKNRLIQSLEHCDEFNRIALEKGIDNVNKKIKELQNERKSLLILINQKMSD